MNAGWQRFELISGEWRLCLACNRWVAGSSVLTFFRAISRLGDGIVWYVLMLALVLFCGERGWRAALHMSAVGVAAATLYRWLKRWTAGVDPIAAMSVSSPLLRAR